MARGLSAAQQGKAKKRRPGVQSKNASRGQNGYKKPSRGQGRRR